MASGSGTQGAPLDEESPDLPESLGDFRLLRRLGKGGMAEVYLAEQTSLSRNVAIKILRPELIDDAVQLKRFRTEAAAAGALVHPNIVQVYMVGEAAGVHYIAQEYVHGQTLREFVNRKGPPDQKVAIHIMRQVAAALQAAADAGVVHRDIKPENIMLNKKGEIKVADFGLAQLTLGGQRLNITQENVTMGTPLYMSPEQVSGSKVDHRSDLYSFGVTCYHMLTGHPPFRGETAVAVAMQHLRDTPEPLEKLRPDLPPVLCKIVQRMMAKDLDQRYQSAKAILDDLRKLRQESTAGKAKPGVADGDSVRNGARSGSGLMGRCTALFDRPIVKQLLPLGIVLGLCSASGAGVGWMLRPKDPLKSQTPAREARIPQEKTALDQWFYAASAPSEAAWKAVIERSPEQGDHLYRQRAKEQLAMLYLIERRTTEASTLFNEAAAETAEETRAFGLAGQAIVAARGGEYQRSQEILDQVRPLYARLDPVMREMVQKTVQANRKQMSAAFLENWDKVLHEAPGEME